jgi:Tannase and feruloyl esterase
MITIRRVYLQRIGLAALAAALLATLTLTPTLAAALPTCVELGTNPAYGLAGNPRITGLTATVVPLGPGVTVPYCRADFTFSGESGPSAGYRPGQSEQIRLRVGLPLSAADGGIGGVQGAWNGKNRDLGGGGYAGNVGGVTSSTNLGYVGTSTDTGHNSAVQAGGSFALNPDNTLNSGQIRDFAEDGIRQQYLWGVQLAKTYYGSAPVRKYWVGCSTGGRQGHYQAQNFPTAYDGILAGAPAFNWDRFIPSELWPQIVMNQDLGAPIAPAKLTAVSNAAIAACDALDGVPNDGIIEDPRKCTYDARSFVCGISASPNCLTAAEADAVNKIWNGPVTSPGPDSHDRGARAWYGLERGASLAGLAGPSPFSIAVDHFRYWIKQDPAFDWHTVTEASFFDDFLTSVEKFNEVIGTDDDLRDFRKAGGKMITYHGLFDQLIMPRGTYNYYNRVKDSLSDKQKYYRFFPYPNAGHCGGAGLDEGQLFSALVNWVEHGVEPEYLVAQVSATRTRKICKYPDVQTYNGIGSIDDHNSFTCQVRKKDDKALLEQDKLDKAFEPKLGK